MELVIEPLMIPEKIFSFNYEEMMEWAKKEAESYKSIACTEKDLPEMKKDRAEANRKIKVINDERIRRKKEWMNPYEEFEARVKRITGVLQEVSDLRGEQIREVEDRIKQEKKQKIEEFFSTYPHSEWLKLSQIWEERWLNASVSLKRVQEEIDGHVDNIEQDVATLSDLPEFAFEAIETYKSTLDLNKSIAEGHRLSEMQKRKAEQERIKAEQEKARAEQERLRREQEIEIAKSREEYADAASVGGVHMPGFPYVEPSKTDLSPRDEIPFDCTQTIIKEWVSFKAFMAIDDAKALKEFFESRNIEFSRI